MIRTSRRGLAAAIVVAALAGTVPASAQRDSLVRSSDGLWFMYFDSTGSKSTLVEFDDGIAMIEFPGKDQGSAGTQADRDARGERAIAAVKAAFPSKPLRYLIHSHSHAHSLSSTKPFLDAGVMLVSTRENFARLGEVADSTMVAAYPDRISFVEGDSMVIEAPGNRIVVHRFTQADFPNSPTSDYLYCFLPRYNFLHCGCMYNKWAGEPVEGKELLTGREEDLHRFLSTRDLSPESLIRLNREKKEPSDLQPAAGLSGVVANGISAVKLSERFLALDEATIRDSRDSVLRSVVQGNIPTSVINRAVYSALDSGDLPKALRLAHLQALAGPSDPNVWDTLGEAYYESGDTLLARSYGRQAKLISPTFEGGGEEGWKKAIAERRAKAAKGK